MKDKILNFVVDFLNSQGEYSKKDLLKIRYGLEGIYLTITKLLIILVVSLLMSITKEIVICLLLFNIIRYFSFGFHAEKSYECLILSLLNFIVIPYLLLNFYRPFIIDIILAAFCLILLGIFSPADTVKRPLKSKKKRTFRKLVTLIVGSIYFTLMIIFRNHYISDLLLCVLVVDVIVVNPITYWIFKQPYNNYKN